jgi:hypothetical protein
MERAVQVELDVRTAIPLAPIFAGERLSVSAVAMSDMVVLAHTESMVVPVTTGLPAGNV